MASAPARQRSSRYIGPMTCTPTGSPPKTPADTATAGSPTKLVALHSRIARVTRSCPPRLADSTPGSTAGSVNTGPGSSGRSARRWAQSRCRPSRTPVSRRYPARSAGGVTAMDISM